MATLPSKSQIRAWIADHPHATSKARHRQGPLSALKGANRIDLKRILKELEAEGHLEKRGKTYRDPDKLPPVSVLQLPAPRQARAILFARPLEWQGEGPEPKILFLPPAPPTPPWARAIASPGPPARRFEGEDHQLHRPSDPPHRHQPAQPPARRLPAKAPSGGRIVPILERLRQGSWQVRPARRMAPATAELGSRRSGRPQGLAWDPDAPRASLTHWRDPARAAPHVPASSRSTTHCHPRCLPRQRHRGRQTPTTPAGLQGPRRPLREHAALSPYDPSDAAATTTMPCYSPTPTPTPKSPGGHVPIHGSPIGEMIAHYASRPALPRHASTARPNKRRPTPPISPTRRAPASCTPTGCRVTCARCTRAWRPPRLPRPVRPMVIAADGTKISHRFVRGLMRSVASLHYEEVQAARDGQPNDKDRAAARRRDHAPLRRLRGAGPPPARAVSPSTSTCPSARSCPERGGGDRLDLPSRTVSTRTG